MVISHLLHRLTIIEGKMRSKAEIASAIFSIAFHSFPISVDDPVSSLSRLRVLRALNYICKEFPFKMNYLNELIEDIYARPGSSWQAKLHHFTTFASIVKDPLGEADVDENESQTLAKLVAYDNSIETRVSPALDLSKAQHEQFSLIQCES